MTAPVLCGAVSFAGFKGGPRTCGRVLGHAGMHGDSDGGPAFWNDPPGNNAFRHDISSTLRLDLGSGHACAPGFEGVDLFAPFAEHHVNLCEFPWPWADNSVDELRASHFLEHLPMVYMHTGGAVMNVPRYPEDRDLLCRFMDEAYRVLKPGGKFTIVVPSGRSNRAFQDPTHRRFFVEESFRYFNQAWRAEHGVDHYLCDCDFDVTTHPTVPAEILAMYPLDRVNAIDKEWNTTVDFVATLVSRKVRPDAEQFSEWRAAQHEASTLRETPVDVEVDVTLDTSPVSPLNAWGGMEAHQRAMRETEEADRRARAGGGVPAPPGLDDLVQKTRAMLDADLARRFAKVQSDLARGSTPPWALTASFMVIDDFLENPNEARANSLAMTFREAAEYKGHRSTTPEYGNALTSEIHRKLKALVGGEYDGRGAHHHYHWTPAGTPEVYHADVGLGTWGGVLYLTPGAPLESGTSLFRHRKSGRTTGDPGDYSEIPAPSCYLDPTEWDETDFAGNVFNRLVLFRSDRVHSMRRPFGSRLDNARLTMLFFLDVEAGPR